MRTISKEVEEAIVSKLEIDSSSSSGLSWKINTTRIKAGDYAGSLTRSGYYLVNVDGMAFYNHRLVYFLAHGQWPEGEVDHIDGDRSNNAIENLRDVSRSENSQNHRDVKGFFWHKEAGKWMARIRIDGKQIHLGRYDNMLDARAAYLRAKHVYHPTSPINQAA